MIRFQNGPLHAQPDARRVWKIPYKKGGGFKLIIDGKTRQATGSFINWPPVIRIRAAQWFTADLFTGAPGQANGVSHRSTVQPQGRVHQPRLGLVFSNRYILQSQ